ncbi:DUF4381 domain-containing protein [Denitrificimonas sp. JX-1]|uniref:DUF4381 domain-containing protein n=1 Tax=Denitrificimonas halotolerans TaxID=3098930 RepID=A0ABU5GTY1_9GAMM|nr:DUF4381 domain-containing protein [Denitrificimonas sp. JX-1]MDY7220092.1 DUF4381 domain-containing protein [Denitrificimonas sp. JX-1]
MITLEQLQPIILPPPVSWWPPAIGWWLLTLLLVALLIGWHYLLRRRTLKCQGNLIDPLRASALQELYALDKPFGGQQAGPWLQQLNQLLKRICATHYPDYASHTLSGREWLAFLDSRCPAAGLTRWMILVHGAYQPDCRLDDKSITQLQQAIETWIRKYV